jgi:fermentation-respiration switch protein FrsA (DUF1100 family)
VTPGHRRPLGSALAGVGLMVSMLAGCGSDAEPEGPFAVGVRDLTFVDRSRPTPATRTAPEKPSRTLVTKVWYPARGRPSRPDAAEARPVDARFPLVVFSHGQAGEPDQYAAVLRTWARAGFVVAAPRFPVTVRGTPGGPVIGDVLNQPGDISFLISALGDELPDLVDDDHVAAAGHSSGAVASLAVAYHTCCHDDRVDLALLEAVTMVPFPDGSYFDDLPSTPTLFLHGDRDGTYARGREVFADAQTPKLFVTVGGGGHSDPYRSGPPDPRLVARAGTHVLDRYLNDDEDALERLTAALDAFPFARLEVEED